MGDNPEQQFEWALKNGDMDQVKSIVEKVGQCRPIGSALFRLIRLCITYRIR